MGASDLAETLRLWPLVWALSMLDIRLRYRGSVLGPFWLTLSTAVMVGSIGFLYSRLFHQNIAGYLPFLSISLVLWNYISTITAEGCICFTQSESMIRAMRTPLSLHAARVVMRNILILGHNIVVIVVVFIIFRTVPSLAVFSILPACVLWVVDSMAICLILGIFGARFRDIPPIIGSVVQIAFYLTPVMWNPTMLEHRGLSRIFIEWNPFFALLEIMRGPLLGNPFSPGVWSMALGYSTILVLLAGFVFTRTRPRIAYWV
ncbi:MAG TPA: ABC transporter permease [Acidocella sp.]|nr:ABC transporter permease [Acidocella sp.]